MKLYLCGKMSGIPDYNRPTFRQHAAALRRAGHSVTSPDELDASRHIVTGEGHTITAQKYAAVLADDICIIASPEVEALAVIPGGGHSGGSLVEITYAQAIGKPVFYLDAHSVLHPTGGAKVLIGLSGYARAGKDSIADHLVNHHGYTRLAFADRLKAVAYDSVQFVRDLVDKEGWEAAKGYEGVRRLLQDLGVAARKHLYPNVWVDPVMADIQPGGKYVISDCRFPNEAKAINDRGGWLGRVERPGIGPVNDHESERGLYNWTFHHTVFNDGTLDTLAQRAEALSALVSAGLHGLRGTALS